jgi:hypothetical protein
LNGHRQISFALSREFSEQFRITTQKQEIARYFSSSCPMRNRIFLLLPGC